MKSNKIQLILFLLILIPFSVFGQKKSDLLKKQERALIKKIENTKVLISETKATKKLTLSELYIINKQIKYRE